MFLWYIFIWIIVLKKTIEIHQNYVLPGNFFVHFVFMLRDFLYAKLILHSVWLWGKVKSQLVIKLQFLYFYHLWTFLLRLNTLDEIYCSTLPTYRPIDFNSSTIFFGKPSKSYFRHTKNDFFFNCPAIRSGGWMVKYWTTNKQRLKMFFFFFFNGTR